MAEAFQIERLGTVMEPDAGDPDEAWGVLNPASARARDGTLYLFPRVVAANNYSRVGIARVALDGDRPVVTERLGYALEPTESWERNPRTAGCEDPRITFVPALDRYVMTYTAYGPLGPRIALAVSDDALEWHKLGLVKFAAELGVELDFYTNKDAVIFPELLEDPEGRPSLAMLHRPTYELPVRERVPYAVVPRGVADPRPSIWLSYCAVDDGDLLHYGHHRLVATPEREWERLKIGAGTPPVLLPYGWLLIYHGVSGSIVEGLDLQPEVRYVAGVMVLDRHDPTTTLYRSPEPVLLPETEEEKTGMVNNVVFPTAIDDLGSGLYDVYYGMADARIGAGRMSVPPALDVDAPS